MLPFKCDCCVAGLLGVQAYYWEIVRVRFEFSRGFFRSAEFLLTLAVEVAAFYWHFLAEGICHGPGDPRPQMALVL